MKITKAKYEAAKKKLLEMQKHKQVVDAWNNSVKDCPMKDQITAISIKDGIVKLEIENRVAK